MLLAKVKLYTEETESNEISIQIKDRSLIRCKSVEDIACGSDSDPINLISFESNHECRPGS